MSSAPRPHQGYDSAGLIHPSHIDQRAPSGAGTHSQPLNDLHQDQGVPPFFSHNSYTHGDPQPHSPYSPDSTEPMMYRSHPLQAEQNPSSSQSSLPLAPGNSGRPGPSHGYDVERAQPSGTPAPGMPQPSRPANSRTQSWDLLSGIKKFEHSYEEFDSRNASESHLAFADGDVPKNKVRSNVVLWCLIGLTECNLMLVFEFLPLPAECVNREPMDTLYRARVGNPLDSRYPRAHIISKRRSE
jgi:hypothetical protein